LQPDSAPLLARRGAHYVVAGAPRLALRDFERSIKLDDSDPDSYLGRGLALAALGQRREAVADAAKAMGMSEPNSARLYSAARIHALAAIAEAAEVGKAGKEAAWLAMRHQDQAVKLLAEWLRRLPPAERSSSFQKLLQDPAMATLRHRLRALELAGPVSPAAGSSSQPRP
jgi:tetratricopeptide (TPR) repeat protein